MFRSLLGKKINIVCENVKSVIPKQFCFREFANPHIYTICAKDVSPFHKSTYTGLKIAWDGQTSVYVEMSTLAAGKTCGLCGNFNGNPDDDFMTPQVIY